MAFFSKKEPAAPAKAGKAKQGASANGVAKVAAVAPDEATKAAAERARKSATALGEIVSVLIRTPEFQQINLGVLRTIVTPAIASGQYLTLTGRRKQTGAIAPLAVAMWALVSEEVDRRLAAGGAEGLKPGEWTSGDIPWLVVLAGDQDSAPLLVARLQQTILKDKALKVLSKDDAGKSIVRTIPAPSLRPGAEARPS